MKVVSVNVGLPREVSWKGRKEKTGIFKVPVKGRVQLRSTNLEGDQQADRSVHGGFYKSIYGYPIEHYGYWQGEYPQLDINYGFFGENLTTEGLDEANLRAGDQLIIGSVELQVTHPRLPCWKLGMRFGDDGIIERFLRSELSGFYFSVVEQGEIESGMQVTVKPVTSPSLTIREIQRLYLGLDRNRERLQLAASLTALPPGWRDRFKKRAG